MKVTTSTRRQEIAAPQTRTGTHVLIVRGENRGDLQSRAATLADALPDVTGVVEWARRENLQLAAGGARLGIVWSSADDLRHKLRAAGEKLRDPACRHVRDVGGIYFTSEPLHPAGKIAFLFPGEGAQYLNMLGDLGERFEEVRRFVDVCDSLGGSSAEDRRQGRFLFFPPAAGQAEREAAEAELRKLGSAIFTVLIADGAIGGLLENLGLKADMVAGHSAGELAALWAAGCLGEEGFVQKQVADTMHGLEDEAGAAARGTLLAVGAPRDEMQRLVESTGLASEVFVAMDNCPHQTVLVGAAGPMAVVEGSLKQQGRLYERLPIPRPYHTPLFESFMRPLETMFAGVDFQPPHTPIYSASTARPFPAEPAAIRRLALSHWARPVEFTRLIENMYAEGARIFVEVGPRGNLTSFVEDILRGRPHLAAAANLPRRGGVEQIHHLAAQLAAHGVPIRFAHLHGDSESLKPKSPHRPNGASGTPPPRFASAGPSRADVVGAHWGVMDRFLASQAAVMQQFLARRGNGAVMSRRRAALPAAPIGRPGSSSAGDIAAPQSPRVHAEPPRLPLIGEIVRHQGGREIVVRRKLDLKEDLYAADHTVGGRQISKVDPQQHGLPIGPMTFTLEMMAEAATLLMPGKVVVGIKNVKLQRWLAFYEEDPRTVECAGRLLAPDEGKPEPGASVQLRFDVKDLGDSTSAGQERPCASAIVLMADRYPEPPAAGDFPLTGEYPSRTSLREMYDDLFHGELFEGVVSLDRSGAEGIEGRVRVLPRDRLFASTSDPQFVADPVLMDVIMHPLGAWHLEQPNRAGRVLLPFELERIELFGPRPPVGMEMTSRARVVQQSSRHFVHSVDAVRPDGRLWCRLTAAKYWRWYFPFGEINFHGRKDEYFISRSWPQLTEMLGAGSDEQGPLAHCVLLDPPGDLGNDAMLEVTAKISLAPAEQRQFAALPEIVKRRAEWMFGRMAAKDAARLLWWERGGERLFPADIVVEKDGHGRPSARYRGDAPCRFPNVSLSHSEGRYAAIAAEFPFAGIDLEKIVPRDEAFEQAAFSAEELALLAGEQDRSEAVTRLWCAKEAVGKALGRGLESPRSVIVRKVEPASGALWVTLGENLQQQFPALAGAELKVVTLREGGYLAAATICERKST